MSEGVVQHERPTEALDLERILAAGLSSVGKAVQGPRRAGPAHPMCLDCGGHRHPLCGPCRTRMQARRCVVCCKT